MFLRGNQRVDKVDPKITCSLAGLIFAAIEAKYRVKLLYIVKYFQITTSVR